MLTPVAASSNADVNYHGPPAQNVRTMQEQAGRTMPQTAIPGDTAPAAMARINILSLTGQLQFIHSMSVLAETLSTIVNLPRRPGESAEDHIERLVARIRSLPPQERRVVEAQLNLLLQGATLKALAEALKNPSGPDAARLAVMLEMSRYKDRDLAARAAVTSYRQNSGTDLPYAQATGARPAPAVSINAPATAPTPGSMIAAALQKAGDIATRYISGTAAQPEQALTPLPETDVTGEVASAPAQDDEGGVLTATNPENAAGEDIDATSSERLHDTVAAAVSEEREEAQTAADDVRADSTQTAERADDQQQGDEQPDVADARHILHEERDPRLIRQLATNIAQATQTTAPKGDSLTNFLLSVLVPDKAAESAAAAPAQPLPSGEELSEQQNARIKTDEMTTATPRGMAGGAEPEIPGAPDARAASTAAQQAEAARNTTIRPEQQSLQAGAMIAAVLGREAIIPLPYVAYLPAKEEPETPAQHRGNAPSGGEEEAAGDEQQEEMQDEQEASDEADEPEADKDGAESAQEPQGAHDFYQRMSDWN